MFSVDVWKVVIAVIYVLLMCTSQLVALVVALAVGFLLQKMETTKSPGFIRHWYYANLGLGLKGFPARPFIDRSMRI